MKLLIVAVGQRMPDWAQSAYDDYAKRFPPELRVEIKTVKTETRAPKHWRPCWPPSASAFKPCCHAAAGWWCSTNAAPL